MNGEGALSRRLREVDAQQQRLAEDSARLPGARLTVVQRTALTVDAALRELAAVGSEREQTVGLDLVRRRLRRDLDRIAVSQEWAA